MVLTTVFIDLSAVNLEGVQKYAELIAANVDVHTWDVDASEKQVETTEGPNGSYGIGRITLRIETDKLNNCLVQIDAVNGGMVEDEENVLDMVFGDARVEVTYGDNLKEVVQTLMQQNLYLQNKIQEVARNHLIMQGQFSGVLGAVSTANKGVLSAQERISAIQTYIHGYVNVNGLVKTVQRIGEAVDSDLLEDFSMHTIH